MSPKKSGQFVPQGNMSSGQFVPQQIIQIIQPAREARERASRAWAVTVSQCPHSEVGQDFLLRRRVTLTEIAVTRKRKV